MAVRVRLSLRGPRGKKVETVAVLNGGFEVPEPHLLLPALCVRKLLGDFRRIAVRQEMTAAGGPVCFLSLLRKIHARVLVPGRKGPESAFSILVSEKDTEALVSDAGIDLLGVRIESFSPGRWRFMDETQIRESEAPQVW